jgi:hypothetical protein
MLDVLSHCLMQYLEEWGFNRFRYQRCKHGQIRYMSHLRNIPLQLPKHFDEHVVNDKLL